MTAKTKRVLKVQVVGDGLPFVKVSVADLRLWKGDFVEVSHERGTLRLKKTKPPKPKAKSERSATRTRTPKPLAPSRPTRPGRPTSHRIAHLALTQGMAAVTELHQTEGFAAKTFDSAIDLVSFHPEVAANLAALRANLFG